jgi:hypothetical protein
VGRHTERAVSQRRAAVATVLASALLLAGGALAFRHSLDERPPRPGIHAPTQTPTPTPEAPGPRASQETPDAGGRTSAPGTGPSLPDDPDSVSR